MKRFFRFLKFTTISISLALILSYVFMKFLEKKIQEEAPAFIFMSNDIRLLNDTYALCNGLIQSNPTIENIKTCKMINDKIQKRIELIKDNNPYISFYHKYIQRIEY